MTKTTNILEKPVSDIHADTISIHDIVSIISWLFYTLVIGLFLYKYIQNKKLTRKQIGTSIGVLFLIFMISEIVIWTLSVY